MSTAVIRELSQLSSIKNHWVALDFRTRNRDESGILLRSGACVVDYDAELDVLCARLRANRETSLTIVYAGAR